MVNAGPAFGRGKDAAAAGEAFFRVGFLPEFWFTMGFIPDVLSVIIALKYENAQFAKYFSWLNQERFAQHLPARVRQTVQRWSIHLLQGCP
jgi:hypothetical protein